MCYYNSRHSIPGSFFERGESGWRAGKRSFFWGTVSQTLDETGFAEGYRKLLRMIREGTRARIVCMGPFIFPWPLEYRNWIPLIREIEEVSSRTGASIPAA